MEVMTHSTSGIQELRTLQKNLIRRRQAENLEREARVEARQKELESGFATKRLLDQAADSMDSKMVGDPLHDLLCISNRDWAERICAASRAFAVTPGFQVLRDRPLPPEGEVFEHGLQLFRLAQNMTPQEIEGLLEESRSLAGLPSWTPEQGARQPSEVELGVWMVLRQLNAYFDGVTWGRPPQNPPETIVQPPTPRSANSAVSAPAPARRLENPPLSPACQAVWRALEFRVLSVDQIVQHLKDSKRAATPGSVRQALTRIKKRGHRILNSDLGYSRPDAPPSGSGPRS